MLCCRVCSLLPCGHLLGKGWSLGRRVCFVFLCFVTPKMCPGQQRLAPLSHWYPGSDVVLDCIDSWSLHHYLLLSPPVNVFTDRSKAVLRLWIIYVILVLCLSCFRACSLLPCGHLLGKVWPLGFCFWCVFFWVCISYFHMWCSGSGVVLVSIPGLCRISYFGTCRMWTMSIYKHACAATYM